MYILGLIDHLHGFLSKKKTSKPRYRVAAIIPAYNEEKSISATIQNLLHQKKYIEQIIIVDDASSDDTYFKADSFPEVLVLKNEERMGKAYSINRALRLVDTKYTLVVDADTIIEDSYIEKILEKMEDQVAAACGYIIPSRESSNKAILGARVIEDLYSQSTLKRGQRLINGIFVASGCCSVYDTKILRRLQVPEDTVTEDLDLTWIFHNAGYKINFEETFAYTLEPRNLVSYIHQIKRWYAGFFQTLSKHNGKMRSKSLIFTVTLILCECFIFTFLWISIVGLALASIIIGGELALFRTILFILLGIDLFTICFPAIIYAYKTRYLTSFVLGLPVYYFLRVVNSFVWWNTLTEWLFDWVPAWRKSH